MKAIGNYIVIETINESLSKTKGGLELGEKHKEDIRYKKGIVVSSGPDVLKKGQEIMFDKVSGFSMEHGKEIYKVINLRDVIAII
tara:strand:+ start:188 stop:442 length:255 start_codon:yes stop_codon:yes gene_type:complete